MLEWPPDLFTLIDVLLKRSEAYRFVFSPPDGATWPPDRVSDWAGEVEEAGRQWSAWAETRSGPLPDLLTEEWRVLQDGLDTALERVAEGYDWRLCEALITVHAIADEACAGLGVPLHVSDGKGCIYRARGRELLARTGTLARIPPHLLRVLPRVRTPPNGTSLRSLSRYACVHAPGVDAHWYRMPVRRTGTDPGARHSNLLLLPWPLRVRESDFRPVEGSVQRQAHEPFGLFEFLPAERFDLDLVSRTILAAREEVDSVDVVILPESALDESEVAGLEALLDRHGVTALITGVRQSSRGRRRLPGNWVHTGYSPRLSKGSDLEPSTGEEWFHIRQNKHHRWSLDERQIHHYHLGGALHPHIRWWEAMEVPRRTIHFVELGDEITLAALVCEDLAQIDDVAEVIRSVGPTVVVTPLLDGPQLKSRWAARYASVLADDPGSAVLTLSSFGMVQRCRPRDRDSSAVVALWKDPVRGTREIPLESGAHGVLLTLCGDYTWRRSGDGRAPVGGVTRYFDVAVHQVRAASAGLGPSSLDERPVTPPALTTEDLSILTGWAEAVGEAMACAPDCLAGLLAEAHAGAPWRAKLGIPDPSPRLCEAFDYLIRAVRLAAPLGGAPSLDELADNCREDWRDAHGLETLTRRVLRASLDQLLTRQSRDVR
jgi:hypothetical protein